MLNGVSLRMGDVSKRREGRRRVGGECWGSRLFRYRLLLSPCSASMPLFSSRSLAIEMWSRSMRRSYSCTGRVASASTTSLRCPLRTQSLCDGCTVSLISYASCTILPQTQHQDRAMGAPRLPSPQPRLLLQVTSQPSARDDGRAPAVRVRCGRLGPVKRVLYRPRTCLGRRYTHQ
jgi:hypothetical protein